MARQTLAIVAAGWLSMTTAQAVNMEMVTVGNAGNAPDTRYATPGYGAVGYAYDIGKFEVTAGQYTEFLNAVAANDLYGLYNPDMWSSGLGCWIARSGSAGSYAYTVTAEWANRPANFVSWGDAARFCNWLTNGQPTGGQSLLTTEDGSYYLNGATSDTALLGVARKPGAQYVIPNQDEWHKAAYHKNDGVTGNYWDYPTGTDVPPTPEGPPGGGNSGNFDSVVGHTTDVGAYALSFSPYGTFDQGGNLWEWNETALYTIYRETRGGSWIYHQGGSATRFMIASSRNANTPASSFFELGFRVALVPEPATFLLLALGGLAVHRRRR